MIRVVKGQRPEVLQQNEGSWLDEFLSDPQNGTKRYRYRTPEIKQALIAETHSKCIYCESKIGHNTPGDVEHKIPTSLVRERHFDWENLTIACTECNRRKNDYLDAERPFLDPYADNVEARLVHYGPVVAWVDGDAPAEITVRKLALNESTRLQLILRKIEKLEQLSILRGRIVNELSEPLRLILETRLEEMQSDGAEYAGMIRSAMRTQGSVRSIEQER
ncbi:hypothetical protein ACG33_00015 [Steroidobacter denitrificans]|uniref:HNH domain-containing protein n=1 Tax=Steroidobacter denitrificans TaxID=465721 RepID=A0A127F7H6_STEDE|nr:HNH endonuclease signature motif containing protein [Steroidobacter denitrificans]AMN45510.1 hypothetical protein ACG33_00015 [Steroidobacter denitrificans]